MQWLKKWVARQLTRHFAEMSHDLRTPRLRDLGHGKYDPYLFDESQFVRLLHCTRQEDGQWFAVMGNTFWNRTPGKDRLMADGSLDCRDTEDWISDDKIDARIARLERCNVCPSETLKAKAMILRFKQDPAIPPGHWFSEKLVKNSQWEATLTPEKT